MKAFAAALMLSATSGIIVMNYGDAVTGFFVGHIVGTLYGVANWLLIEERAP